MANWRWMFPPRNCGDCLCVKKVWRSTRSRFGVWSAPILMTVAYNVVCDSGSGWRLTSACEAEFVQYIRCGADKSPPKPTIPAPDCPTSPIPSCPPCVAEAPASAIVTIPGNWGTRTGPLICDPLSSYIYREPPAPGIERCSWCDDIPEVSFVLDAGSFFYSPIVAPCGITTSAWCWGAHAYLLGLTYPCVLGSLSRSFTVFDYHCSAGIDASTSPCTFYVSFFLQVIGPCVGSGGPQSAFPLIDLGFSYSALLPPSIVNTSLSMNLLAVCAPSGCSAFPSTINVQFGAAA